LPNSERDCRSRLKRCNREMLRFVSIDQCRPHIQLIAFGCVASCVHQFINTRECRAKSKALEVKRIGGPCRGRTLKCSAQSKLHEVGELVGRVGVEPTTY
jgi:transcriptional regulator CtsR